jgi:hypothetical protein
MDPHFLDLNTSWRWVVSFTPRPLNPRGKSPRYPLDRRLGGPQCRSGKRGEEKILEPTGTWTPTPRSSSPYPVAIPTTLSRILCFMAWQSKFFTELGASKNSQHSYINGSIMLCHKIWVGLPYVRWSYCLVFNDWFFLMSTRYYRACWCKQ